MNKPTIVTALACPADAGSICGLCFKERRRSFTILTTELLLIHSKGPSCLGMTRQEAVLFAGRSKVWRNDHLLWLSCYESPSEKDFSQTAFSTLQT